MKIAVVTGAHPFPEAEFDHLYSMMPGIQFVREEFPEFASDPARRDYDAVVFYNFHQETPDAAGKAAVEDLLDAGCGIVALHHALLAFPEWDVWREVCGIDILSFGYDTDQRLMVHVEDPDHPITEGIPDWTLVDETYRMKTPDEDSQVLLTVDHPNSMKHLAWVRTCRKSRIFCLQSGHDTMAYGTPQFATTLERGIHWVANG